MADLTAPPDLFEQIRLIAGLRWRILRNGLRKKNNRADLIGMIFAGLFSSVLVVGISIAFYFGANTLLAGPHSGYIAFLFWAIFLYWQIIPVLVAGFSTSFEFKTLLRFPMSMSAFYVIALAYGFADIAAVASISWLAAMTLGATVLHFTLFFPMFAVAILFVILNLTLERLIGSWIERLLARRRTREIIVGLFILSMISLQFISPIVQSTKGLTHPWIMKLLPYFAPLPASLAGRAISAAAVGHFYPFFACLVGLSLYALVFSALLWQRFSSQYRGEELSETIAPARVAARVKFKLQPPANRPALLPPVVSSVLRKEFFYVIRNGLSLFSLIMPPVLVVVFSLQLAGKHPTMSKHAVSPDLFFPGMMAYLMLILLAPAYNSFAYEGKGIQTYFTAPIRFRDVLLAKNLMVTAIFSFEIFLCMFVLIYRVGRPSAPTLFATIAGLVFTVVAQLIFANWSSLKFPRKLEFGQMRGQRNSGVAVWIMFGAQIILGGSSAVILGLGRWTGNPWLPVEIFSFLAVIALSGYFASLDALSDLAEKQKEPLIEALCR